MYRGEQDADGSFRALGFECRMFHVSTIRGVLTGPGCDRIFVEPRVSRAAPIEATDLGIRMLQYNLVFAKVHDVCSGKLAPSFPIVHVDEVTVGRKSQCRE